MGPMGGMASPSPNPGKGAAGMGKVRQAISLLNEAVAEVADMPELHEAVIKAIGTLAKHTPAPQAQPGAGMQGMKDQILKMLQGGPGSALQRAMAAGPQAAPPPAPAAME